jgi:hypothetical protein
MRTLLTRPAVGIASVCTECAENVLCTLMMVSIENCKLKLLTQCLSESAIDTNCDPPELLLGVTYVTMCQVFFISDHI